MAVDRLFRSEIQIPAAGVGSGGVSSHVVQITHASLITNCAALLDADGSGRAQLDGGDLVMTTDAAGANRVALHVARWILDNNPALSDVLLHVGPLSLSSSTLNSIYLWWGHGANQNQPAAGDSYGQHAVYESGIKGFWGLDASSGTSAADYTNNSNNGTLTNGPTWASGKVGNAVSLDGANDDVRLDHAPFAALSVGTIVGWINPTVIDADSVAIFMGQGTSGNNLLQIEQNGFSGDVRVLIRNNSGSLIDCATAAGKLIVGQWGHFAFSVTVSGNVFYWNGASQAMGYSSGHAGLRAFFSDITSPNHLRFGSTKFGPADQYRPWAGQLDDYRIVNRGLTAAEVKTIYNNGNDPGAFAIAQLPVSFSTWSAALFRGRQPRRCVPARPPCRTRPAMATWFFSARGGPYLVSARGTYASGSAQSDTYRAGHVVAGAHLPGSVAADTGDP